MICKELGALFVHVPKAAGQSVERVLLAEMGLSWATREAANLAPNGDPSRGPPRLAHLTAEEYVKLGWLSAEEFSSMYKFAFVRNPWARLVSEFRYRNFAPRIGFKEFVLSNFPEPADDSYASGEDHYRHVIPQSRFVFDEHGRCLLDFVGRFESLARDFRFVAEKLNLSIRELPHSNASKSHGNFHGNGLVAKFKAFFGHEQIYAETYQSLYDAETRRFVEFNYAEDIERFGYKFEP